MPLGDPFTSSTTFARNLTNRIPPPPQAPMVSTGTAVPRPPPTAPTTVTTNPSMAQRALDAYVGKSGLNTPNPYTAIYNNAKLGLTGTVSNPATANLKPMTTSATTPTSPASSGSPQIFGDLQKLIDFLQTPQIQSAQHGVDLAQNLSQMLQTQLDAKYKDNSAEVALKKLGLDKNIYAAQAAMGRAGETRTLAMQGGADYIKTQGQLTNSSIGDLNIRSAGEARNIAFQNSLLQLAAQEMGLNKEQYLSVQNLLNSQQQNLNTTTNLSSDSTQLTAAANKRNTYNDAAARGAMTSTGAQADLSDIDKQLKIAQDKLREDQRYGTDVVSAKRTEASTSYGKQDLAYQEKQGTIGENQNKSRDQIHLYENEGNRIRTTYGYNVRDSERGMKQADINYRGTLGTLSNQVEQWGIDKKLLDLQMKQSFTQLGIDKQMAQMDYLEKAGALPDTMRNIYQQTVLQAMQYMPLVEQYPWLLQVASKSMSGSK